MDFTSLQPFNDFKKSSLQDLFCFKQMGQVFGRKMANK